MDPYYMAAFIVLREIIQGEMGKGIKKKKEAAQMFSGNMKCCSASVVIRKSR